jgi:hypothetical protein
MRFLATLAATLTFTSGARADNVRKPDDCPAAVRTAIDKLFAKATITKCKAEREHGRDQFEVKLVKRDGSKAEVDLTPHGKILQIEEVIPVDQLPKAVAKAFAARYPKATIDTAEKQTRSSGNLTYELAFAVDGHRKEVTFTDDGKFVEEE